MALGEGDASLKNQICSNAVFYIFSTKIYHINMINNLKDCEGNI